MPSLRRIADGNFIICFRYDGCQYQRSLKTSDVAAAKAAKGRIEDRLYQLNQGKLAVPHGVDPGDFLLHDKQAPKQEREKAKRVSVAELIDSYLASQEGLKEASSLQTERTHLANLKKSLGRNARRPAKYIATADLETFLTSRLKAVQPTTVRKERQTVILFFKWAVRLGHLSASPANDLPAVLHSANRANFRTLSEIEEQIARAGMSEKEQLAAWERLYLREAEVGEILELVKQNALHDFVFPMVAIAAYTGMRRGEILRLRWSDVDFNRGVITATSKKQSQREKATSRNIDMHPELVEILKTYKEQRPKGQYVICWADTLEPLTVHMAHDHLQRALKKTRWEREIGPKRKKVIIAFHVFRHSFASNLAMQGVDQRIIDSWMGHQTKEMRQRYQHLHPDAQKASITRLSYRDSPKLANSTQFSRQRALARRRTTRGDVGVANRRCRH